MSLARSWDILESPTASVRKIPGFKSQALYLETISEVDKNKLYL